MPIFLALHCYSCGMFQVKQEKKSSNKWSCCICNEKQSVRKVFGRSAAAKDVRKLVQELNMPNQTSGAAYDGYYFPNSHSGDKANADEQNADEVSVLNPHSREFMYKESTSTKRNKWSEYVEEEVEPAFINIIDEVDDDRLVTTIFEVQKGKHKGKDSNKFANAAGAQEDRIPILHTDSQAKRSKCSKNTQGVVIEERANLLSAKSESIQINEKGMEECLVSRHLVTTNALRSKSKAYAQVLSKWANYMDSCLGTGSEEENQPARPSKSSISSTRWNMAKSKYANITQTQTSFEDCNVEENVCPLFL
ncbi:hypothetical protein O6H91_02G047800 [Diphasiastrum complanatum]|uniref:Uncharacterized protein n=1 Tax=Diphasiastrum complanatum TaxID=34168 RepID=A0ACC2EEX3_DIPCM|nr:hypothetical protein O6H91_02G047800 [Diphasiastrum complanatum]